MVRLTVLASSVLAFVAVPLASQQAVPTTQPAVLNIIREIEKPGHFAAHIDRSAGPLNHCYPAMLLALSAVSGPKEVWWVSTFPGMDALGKAEAFRMDNPSYWRPSARSPWRMGALTNSFSTQPRRPAPRARHVPDVKSQRVYQILTITTRPGGEAAFIDIAQRFVTS
jgi:hypothetical protein